MPIGLYEARDFPNIALVEGGPDLLAAFHLAWCATSTPETLAQGKGIDVIGKLGAVAMLGRHPIPEGELRHFKDKRVRLFADTDKPGLQAEGRLVAPTRSRRRESGRLFVLGLHPKRWATGQGSQRFRTHRP